MPSVTPSGLWGSGANDVWTVGGGDLSATVGVVLHWDGSRWAKVEAGTIPFMSAVWGSDSDDVWAVGGDSISGTIVHWDGSTWTRISGSAFPLYAVWGTGPTDVWAVGDHSTILHCGQ